MKKTTLSLAMAVLVLVGIFAVLLAGTGPDNANPQPVTVELDDNFER